MTNNVKMFFEEVSKNPALKKELDNVNANLTNLDKNDLESIFNEKIVSIIEKYGFTFSYQDLLDYKHSLEPQDGEELSDDLLEMASGGTNKVICFAIGAGKECGCVLFGGGKGASRDEGGICFLGGD